MIRVNRYHKRYLFIISLIVGVDDIALSDMLDVPVFGAAPHVSQLYSTVSGARRIFQSARVSAPPGVHDVYTLQQVENSNYFKGSRSSRL